MTSLLAAVCSCGGYGLVAFGFGQLGFLVSLIGSLLWLAYAVRVRSWPLCAQSVFFTVFSAIGLYR